MAAVAMTQRAARICLPVGSLLAIACTPAEMTVADDRQLVPTGQEVRGVWVLETFTIEGEEVIVEVEVNAARVP